MARKQTRGSISLSAATHEAIVAAAQREGVAASELVTRMVRAACPDLPKQLHQSSAEDRRASAAMTRGVPRERRTINRMSAKDVERALAPEPRADALARNPHLAPIPPGATCAHCGERDATVRDREAPYYVSCATCASDARPSGRVVERGYEPNGGLPTAKEVDAAARRVLGDERYEAEAEREKRLGLAPSPRNTNEMDDFVAESIRRQRTRAWSANGRRR